MKLISENRLLLPGLLFLLYFNVPFEQNVSDKDELSENENIAIHTDFIDFDDEYFVLLEQEDTQDKDPRYDISFLFYNWEAQSEIEIFYYHKFSLQNNWLIKSHQLIDLPPPSA